MTANPIEPWYYKSREPEPIVVIENWDLPFHLGAVIKYIARWPYKNETSEKRLEDLKKAAWFLNRFIQHIEERISHE